MKNPVLTLAAAKAYNIRSEALGGILRVIKGKAHLLPFDATKHVLVRRKALLALPVDSLEWQWLRAQGIRRPSPSGPAPDGKTPEGMEQFTLRLAPEHLKRLRARAPSRGVSAWVAERIRGRVKVATAHLPGCTKRVNLKLAFGELDAARKEADRLKVPLSEYIIRACGLDV